jgi:PAS domain S-box-containing protein
MPYDDNSGQVLQEAETRFRAAFESAPIGMAITDLEGRFLQVNRALCDLLGRPEGELLRSTWEEITHPDDLPAQIAYEQNALAGRARTFQMEKRHIRSDGTTMWNLVTRSLVTDAEGRPRYFISQVVDLSAHKRVEQALRSREEEIIRQREELAALHETTLGLISRLEHTSLLEAIITRAATLMRTPHAYLYVVVEAADQLEVRAGTGIFSDYVGYRLNRGQGLAGRVWVTGEPMAVDDYSTWTGRRPEFAFLRAAVSIPLRTGDDIVGVIGLVRMEKERRFSPEDIDLLTRFGRLASLALDNARLYSAAQQELSERRKTEKELERTAAELRQANTELKAADEMKSHFVAVASHELRTPLTSVLGFASTLLAHWDRIPDEDKKEHLKLIEDQAQRLTRLVDDLLTMSKIEAGALETRPVQIDVTGAITQAVSVFANRTPDIAIEAPEGLRVAADPDHVHQILTNYLANALKYGAPPVAVDARDRNGWVEILVRDEGEGVPEEFVPRLFEKFAQAGPTSAGGTGLGLSIVRGLARAQGGDVWYEPGMTRGSLFGVRLPAPA